MKNTTTVITIGIIIIAAIGYIVWDRQNKVAEVPATVITTNTTNTTNNPPITNTTQGGVPIISTGPNVSTTYSTALVTGTVNPYNAFTNYWYEYGMTTNLGSKTANQQIGSGYYVIDAPTYITSLNKNTTYYYRLVAENQYGKVTGASYSFKTSTDSPLPVGSAPKVTTLAANAVTKTGASISGQVNPNQSETKYWFEYGTTANLGNLSGFASAGNGNTNNSVSVVLKDLAPNTTYYFRINAQNQFNTVNGTILTFKTLLAPISVRVN